MFTLTVAAYNLVRRGRGRLIVELGEGRPAPEGHKGGTRGCGHSGGHLKDERDHYRQGLYGW